MTIAREPAAETGGATRPASLVLRLLVVVVVSLVAGGLTSFGQGALSFEFASLANSASGWSLPTAIIVGLLARGFREAAIGGAISFVTLTVGYALVSGWRGFPFDPTTWAVVGVVAGPVVGCAAYALRRDGRGTAIGAGVLAGIFIGEAVYGLTVVADTTSPVYWWIIAAIGAVLLVAIGFRLRRVRAVLVMLAIAAIVAAAFPVAFLLLGAVFTVL